MEADLQAEETGAHRGIFETPGALPHLFKGESSKALLEQAQADIEFEWQELLDRCGETWSPAE